MAVLLVRHPARDVVQFLAGGCEYYRACGDGETVARRAAKSRPVVFSLTFIFLSGVEGEMEVVTFLPDQPE